MNEVTGAALWQRIEEAAREKNEVGEDWELRMVDLGYRIPDYHTAQYRLVHKQRGHISGTVEYNPYVEEHSS